MTQEPKHSPAWYQGYDARCHGLSEAHNAHDLDASPTEHMDWNDGWNEADEEARS